jgi:NADPH-dependent ferric siderophore reductase
MSTIPELPKQRPRRIPRHVFVKGIETLSPSMRRFTFEGDDLATFTWSGPAAHVKVMFPDPETGVLPSLGSGDLPLTIRTYTPRSFDAATHQLRIDFALHDHGIGTTWAAHARAGDEVVIFGPAPGAEIDPHAAWYVLGCDASALPAIETLLETFPAGMPVTVFAEVADEREQRVLPRSPEIHWITRSASEGSSLSNALAAFDWPAGDGRVYVGCESGMVRAIREHLLDTLHFDRRHITTRGYWRRGAANHPDHDYAEEVGRTNDGGRREA